MPGDNLIKLKSLRKSLYFTPHEVADILKISLASARVLCSRYVKKGFFLKIKNNLYTLPEKWENLDMAGKFAVANILQVPSYVSLMSALEYYGITTQIRRNFIESISVKRSFYRKVMESDFLYFKMNRRYYHGFIRTGGVFIALPEKAFVDCVYFYSFGKYKADFNSLDFGKLGKKRVFELLKLYPEKTRKTACVLWKN